jgi:hypothetical protein
MDFTWTTAAAGGTVYAAGKNGVLNSAFNVWQRGTSVSGAGGGAYTADRWFLFAGGQGTVSRQVTNDTTNLPFIQYCARVQRNSGSTDTTGIPFAQSFETLNSLQYAGRTVTLSFYARKGANFSAASDQIGVTLATGTGTDQNYLSAGYTGAATPISQAATLTSTWQRFSYSGTVASTATEVAIRFFFGPTGTAGANDWFEVTGVQLEIAASASAYSPNAATYQSELAACQRYYYLLASGTNASFGTAGYFSSSDVLTTAFYPVTMRTAPTFVVAAGSFYEVVRNSGSNALSTLQANYLTTTTANIFAGSSQGASGTAGHAGQFRTTNASANIAFSAEL